MIRVGFSKGQLSTKCCRHVRSVRRQNAGQTMSIGFFRTVVDFTGIGAIHSHHSLETIPAKAVKHVCIQHFFPTWQPRGQFAVSTCLPHYSTRAPITHSVQINRRSDAGCAEKTLNRGVRGKHVGTRGALGSRHYKGRRVYQ